MSAPNTASAAEFFRRHAGTSYPTNATPAWQAWHAEQHFYDLATAERIADARGIWFDWTYDADGDHSYREHEEPYVPRDFPVQPYTGDMSLAGIATCGTCGLSWDDSVSTQWTPTPSGRCPFEYVHREPATCELCVAYDEDGNVLASLGCIDDATSEYRRVVEAELAWEAISSVPA